MILNLLEQKYKLTIISTLILVSGCSSISPSETGLASTLEIERAESQKANIRGINIHAENEQIIVSGTISKKLNRRGKIIGHLHIEAYDNSKNLLAETLTNYRRQHHNSSVSKFSDTLDVNPEDVTKINVIHHSASENFRSNPNPFSVTEDVVSAGKSIYEANCMDCHGSFGKGDGEMASRLSRKPADVAAFGKSSIASDEYLYWMIYEGGSSFKTGMPSFGNVLTNEEIWQVTSYLRQL